MKQVEVQIPKVFAPLLTSDYRNKFFYGGRAGGKSYAFADSLLLLGRQKRLFIACLREIQNSMKDSVYKLLCDRISFYGLDDYEILDSKIENKITGSRFVFKGLRNQDSQKIKSLEGADIAWIEEAQAITRKSWEILEPTIRKDGSQIWISMNREEENDPLWVLVAANPDARTLVVKVNYYDNPFCPEEIKLQAEKCKQSSPEDYEHIWLGEPRRQGNTKLISATDVRRAFQQQLPMPSSPLIIGVDVARFGDDKTVFCFRRGRSCFRIESFSGLDVVEVANQATFFIRENQPKRVFVDIGGVGAGVYDILKDRGLGEVVKAVNFGERALLSERYANRRAEMWDNLHDWLISEPQVALFYDEDLLTDLCCVNKKYDRRGRLLLEEKDEIKKRLGRSPDKADALALTFAERVFDNLAPQMYRPKQLLWEDVFNSYNQGDDKW